MKNKYKYFYLLAIILISPQALAHDSNLTTGLSAGFAHPLLGIDHLIALLLAGVFVGRTAAGQKLTISLLMFISALALGSVAGMLLGAQAGVEAAILLSIPVFIALQWIKYSGQIKMATGVMSFFMIAHGWMHGVEMAGMDKNFIVGFLLSSAIILGLSSMLGARPGLKIVTSSHA